MTTVQFSCRVQMNDFEYLLNTESRNVFRLTCTCGLTSTHEEDPRKEMVFIAEISHLEREFWDKNGLDIKGYVFHKFVKDAMRYQRKPVERQEVNLGIVPMPVGDEVIQGWKHPVPTEPFPIALPKPKSLTLK